MSRIPHSLARRIDRAARRAHAFHQWAHHPLCDAYAWETISLGRIRICRGCTLAAAGALAGGALALALPRPSGPVLLAAAVAFSATLRLAVSPRSSPTRRSKLATRGLPALLAAWCAVAGLLAGGVGLAAAAVVGLGLWAAIAGYRRRGPSRTACDVCPERAALAACSGFRPIARREAALRRLAARWLDAGPAAEARRSHGSMMRS